MRRDRDLKYSEFEDQIMTEIVNFTDEVVVSTTGFNTNYTLASIDNASYQIDDSISRPEIVMGQGRANVAKILRLDRDNIRKTAIFIDHKLAEHKVHNVHEGVVAEARVWADLLRASAALRGLVSVEHSSLDRQVWIGPYDRI